MESSRTRPYRARDQGRWGSVCSRLVRVPSQQVGQVGSGPSEPFRTWNVPETPTQDDHWRGLCPLSTGVAFVVGPPLPGQARPRLPAATVRPTHSQPRAPCLGLGTKPLHGRIRGVPFGDQCLRGAASHAVRSCGRPHGGWAPGSTAISPGRLWCRPHGWKSFSSGLMQDPGPASKEGQRETGPMALTPGQSPPWAA